MLKIIFNDQEFEINSWNHSINLLPIGTILNIASCSINSIVPVNELSNTNITSIKIKKDDIIIYLLENIISNIINITEFINADIITTNINIEFN